jgi:tetratricopeptide (TPR) repeat protein
MITLVSAAALKRRRPPPPPEVPDRDSPTEIRRSRSDLRRLRKVAAVIESKEGADAAGTYLISEGLRDEAVQVFLKSDNHLRAAEVLHDQNRFAESAQLYEEAGQVGQAAAIYAQLERFSDAARCYLEADKKSVAGEMLERAGNDVEAGRCYHEIGFHRQAAEAFLRASCTAEAAESLVALFNEEGAGMSALSPTRQEELQGIATKAANLLLELERLDEAERLLVRAGAYSEAGDIALSQEEYDRAAQHFQRAGISDRAADALDRAGDETGAARLRGEHLRDQGDDARAAALLERAEDYAAAGDLYRKLEQHHQAGECYEKAGNSLEAAEMFKTAGSLDRASNAFERGGQLDEAARCASEAGDRARSADLLERGGQDYEAGQLYAEIGRHDAAIRLLQRIEPDHERFSDAAAFLGRLFRSKGMISLSAKKLEQALGDTPISRPTLELHYELAQVHEENGDFEAAMEVYERILTFDYHFRDVAQRLEEAKESRNQRRTEVAAGAGAASDSEGRYRIIRELGRGGMGVVYLARDSVLDRDVAFKVLPEEVRHSQNALNNFLREAKAAAKLNHPHIVTVYDAGKSEYGFYLAMEYVEGSTLKAILQHRGVIPPSGVTYVLRQMADALEYAHRKKVVHRDIKTGNTMWTPARKVKIMDFGLAKFLEEVRNATTLVSGTPFYMSPEQTLGRAVDHRTDLYSLGVTVFELATGQLPFRTGNVPYHHVHTPPPDPREVNSGVPDFLGRIILRCLEKDPDARYPTADAILADLDQAAKSDS